MTEREIEKAKSCLCTRRDGPLRKLFYDRNGMPKEGLLTNRQILARLKIQDFNPNSLEHSALIGILGASLAHLRKQAKDAGLAWIDVETTMDGQKVARHGYMQDISLILANADKFDDISASRKRIAKQTRAIAKRQEIILPHDKKTELSA